MKARWQWKLVAGLFGLSVIASALVFAPNTVRAHQESEHILASHTHVMKSKKGGNISFLLEEYLNPHGQKEIAVYDEIVHQVTVKGQAIVMVGRDLDGDERYDAWFLLGHGGVVKAVDLVSKTEDGWDAISQLLRENADLFIARNMLIIWYEWLSRWSAGTKKLLDLEHIQINLHSLEIFTDRIAAAAPGNAIAHANYARLSEAWGALAERANDGYWGRIRSALTDEALALSGYVILKWAAPIFSRLQIPMADTKGGQFLSETYEKYVQAFAQRTRAAIQRLRGKMPTVPPKLTAGAELLFEPIRLTAKNIKTVAERMVTVMENHGRLSRTLAHLFQHAVDVGKLAVTNKKGYVLGTTATQFSVEVYQRRDALFDLDPIVLPERARNWKELAQNVGFMATESLVGSGVALKTGSAYASMGICAIFSTIDSFVWTRLVKHETDEVRMAMDTGWEVTIGNFQTTVIDPAGFGLGLALATKFRSNKFQLVGWAVTFIDQAAGYVGYNYFTEKAYPVLKRKWKKHQEKLPPVRFVPIVAPV